MINQRDMILGILQSGRTLSDDEKQQFQKTIEEMKSSIDVRMSKEELENLSQLYWDSSTRPKGMLMVSEDDLVYFRFAIE